MTFSLTATTRTTQGKKLQKERAEGKLPAIVYGPKEKPQLITLDHKDFTKVFKEAGESSVIVLKGLGNDVEVIVHDVAIDPVRNQVLHVDFYVPEAGKTVTLHVPLEFTGEAPALKLGGTLTKVLHEVEVTCLPKDMPQHVAVDLSVITDPGVQIHIRDLALPKGVTMVNDAEDVVVLVQAVDEETATETAIDMSAIEVEKKGKTEEEKAE